MTRRSLQKVLPGLLSLVLASVAQGKEFVEVKLGRSFQDKEAVLRGLVDRAPSPNGRVLLMFRGWPGIAFIEDGSGRFGSAMLQEMFEEMIPILTAQGISTVTVDCPTDQWGRRGANPTSCSDRYRSTEQHGRDVEKLIDELSQRYSYREFYVIGHSYGAISSHWLSHHIKGRLHGAIHSATMSVAPRALYTEYAESMSRFDPSTVSIPYIYLHHEQDLCQYTPYAYAAQRGQKHGLITVKGGDSSGPPCGGGSYHSYAWRRTGIAEALAKWINTKEITPLVKGPRD